MLPWLRFRAHPEDKTPLDAARYVVLDTELTSLDRRSNRLLSVGAIAMEGAKIRIEKQFYRVVNPGVAVPAKGVLIHGLRSSDVENGTPPAQVLEDLQAFAGQAVLVGHFAAIDLSVLKKDMGAGATLRNRAVCTAQVQRWILRHGPYSEGLVHQIENLDLISLARSYRIQCEETHHALYDAFRTARIWQKMILALQAMKIRILGELLRIGKAR